MKKYVLFLIFLFVISIGFSQKYFKKEALKEVFTTVDNREVVLNRILEELKGKPVVIKFWASWCKDCIVDMPNVKALKKKYKDRVAFLNFSLDKSYPKWVSGIRKFHVEGKNYFVKSGWKFSLLAKNVTLDWIPRYMILDKNGKIAFARAIKANDKKLLASIEKLLKIH